MLDFALSVELFALNDCSVFFSCTKPFVPWGMDRARVIVFCLFQSDEYHFH
jgi:hypothetical protein